MKIILNKDTNLDFIDFIHNGFNKIVGSSKTLEYIQLKVGGKDLIEVVIKLSCVNNDLRQTFDILYTCELEIKKVDLNSKSIEIGTFVYNHFIDKLKKQTKYNWIKAGLPENNPPSEVIKSVVFISVAS
ncbi:MAG: hypothetical protein ABJB16_06365 [Saprospiraceae bacterium]